MKKGIVITLCGVAAAACILGTGYFGISDYMKTRFMPGTWAGGVYCTGMTVAEVNLELLEDRQAPVVEVKDLEGRSYMLDLSRMDFHYDYSSFLKEEQEKQRKAGWISGIFGGKDLSPGLPDFFYDEEAVRAWWQELPCVKQEEVEPVLCIVPGDNGYTLYNTLGDHLDTEKGLQALLSAINSRSDVLSLKDAGCYFDYQVTAEQESILNDWSRLLKKEACGLTYDFGAEKIVFDEKLMSSFIAKDAKGNPKYDEQGNFYYDQEAVDAYMESLLESYHTYGVERAFQTSRGDTVMVEGVTYGTELDKEAEKAFVWEYLNDDAQRSQKCVHTPVYLHETPVHGLNDIGDTYIEVDITNQKMYFYLNGSLETSSDIVTGNMKLKRYTPQGVYDIYRKQKNRTLRGNGYTAFVRRWIPFYNAYGLHDASWRKTFGGDYYLTEGSRGCVNLPDETADILYEKAEVGTPVIIFY